MVEFFRKIILVSLALSSMAMLTSCPDNNNPDDSVEPIDIHSSFSFSSSLGKPIKKHILEDESFSTADILFLSVIRPDSVRNDQNPSPITSTLVAAYYDSPSKVNFISFDKEKLVLYVAFLSNIHYMVTDSWNFEKFGYNNTYEWMIVNNNLETSKTNVTFCSNLHPVSIDNEADTVYLGRPFTVTWQPASNDSTVIFIDFGFFSGMDTWDYWGVKTADNGSYTFDSSFLQNLGIKKNGYLTVRMLRMKKSFNDVSFTGLLTQKAVCYTMTEAKVGIFLKTN